MTLSPLLCFLTIKGVATSMPLLLFAFGGGAIKFRELFVPVETNVPWCTSSCRAVATLTPLLLSVGVEVTISF